MSIGFMSTETIGEKLRHIREEKELPLRKVAALLDIDVAILSKMERGERRITKEVVLKLANIYDYNAHCKGNAHLLGITIFFSLMGIVLWGCLMGSMLPIILKKFKPSLNYP